MLKVADIIELLKAGWEKRDIIEEVKTRNKCSDRYANSLYHDAIVLIVENSTKTGIEDLLAVQTTRIMAIVKEAIEKKNWSTALKAYDMMNRMHGLYNEKKEVEVKLKDLQFKFGNEQ